MRDSKMMRAWNLIYPVGIYFVVTSVVLFMLDFILPERVDTKLLRQLITSFCVLPFLYGFYKQDAFFRGEVKTLKDCVNVTKEQVVQILLAMFCAGFFAIAWNNILGLFHITDYSASYEQVAKTFYMGNFVLEFVALCIAAPLAEEILYRGIVYKRAKDWLGMPFAVAISAIIFGLVHMNLVQFVYAAVFGVLLAYCVEWTKRLHGAVFAHMMANFLSLLRAETNLFEFMDNHKTIYIASTVFCLVLSYFLLQIGRKIEK